MHGCKRSVIGTRKEDIAREVGEKIEGKMGEKRGGEI
jgi:hypothetical protein